ncbi:DUF1003 domain-containing protein [Streptomyces sp. NPDC015140]|uniref:DUF1003 domain-containing protein n=1 Tax=Actinomycetes TaxID=1760 RepID=UPI001C4DEEFA|nr:DUF1003 domain-containing protein [Rhodococcus qingshengii]
MYLILFEESQRSFRVYELIASVEQPERGHGMVSSSTGDEGLTWVDDLVCPHCGHRLGVFDEPCPGRGERWAAKIADMVGTWWFLAGLVTVIVSWLAVNFVLRPFEPHPATMLTGLGAILATVAALQGPLILLSQRRAAARDRGRAREALRVATNTEADLHAIRGVLVRLEVPVGSDSSISVSDSAAQSRKGTQYGDDA